MNDKSEILDLLVKRVVELVHPLQIILFGSWARGDNSPDSDIDLLVVMPEGTQRQETELFLYEFLPVIGIPFDIIVATPQNLEKHKNNIGLIYYYILKEGRSIYAA
jgi:predicted nucleotidyltransferase